MDAPTRKGDGANGYHLGTGEIEITRWLGSMPWPHRRTRTGESKEGVKGRFPKYRDQAFAELPLGMQNFSLDLDPGLASIRTKAIVQGLVPRLTQL